MKIGIGVTIPALNPWSGYELSKAHTVKHNHEQVTIAKDKNKYIPTYNQ